MFPPPPSRITHEVRWVIHSSGLLQSVGPPERRLGGDVFPPSTPRWAFDYDPPRVGLRARPAPAAGLHARPHHAERQSRGQVPSRRLWMAQPDAASHRRTGRGALHRSGRTAPRLRPAPAGGPLRHRAQRRHGKTKRPDVPDSRPRSRQARRAVSPTPSPTPGCGATTPRCASSTPLSATSPARPASTSP